VSVGLWIAPAVLAGLALFLWFATRLERLVARPAFEPGLPITVAVETRLSDTVAGPDSRSMDGQLGAELVSTPV
jgi:hypothetical protein